MSRPAIDTAETPTDVDVVVVGAGFAGLYALHLLQEKGFTCHAFDAAHDVGGTWYWNRYPGARCDVESLDYCFSFSEEIHRDWSWSERYATQPEILRYAEFVADRLDLRPLISFGAQVSSADWDDASATWVVRTKDGQQKRSRFVITGVGLLSASNTPSIPGLDRFAGRVLHTGHWPHEGVDLTGERVAVIGTGSSGIQVIPSIAEQVAQLTVFQRTPNFSIPARNRPLTAREIHRSKGERDFIRGQAAASPAGYFSQRATQSILEVSPEERRATLERKWAIGGFEFLGAYTDPMTSREANDVLADFVRDKIAEIVHDPETAAKLQPRSHPIMAKRPTVNTDYYETFNRSNVELVDLTVDPLVEITASGVRTESGEHEVDVLVMATGYDAVTGPLVRMGIHGRDGLSLADEWADGARSYLGLAMAGFPNLFTVTGPLSATPLTNVLRSIEHHVEWIVECLEHLRATGAASIETRPEAQEDWDRQIAHVGTFTLHAEASSWYTGGNIEGKARKLMAWVGGLDAYSAVCRKVADDGYAGFELRDSEGAPVPVDRSLAPSAS